MAPVKIASGCDRRCAFCAIPRFRGSFVSRAPQDIVDETGWLAARGVREVFLVSENSTSYGKDLGDLQALERLLPSLTAIDGVDRVRVSYLQPAEVRPGLVEAMAGTPGVAPYFDLSFQHASGPLLRRMRRFGDAETFLELIGSVRSLAPTAGIRSNVIVGFPGETEDDVAGAHRLPRPPPASTSSVSSATPTRTAPKRPVSTASCSDHEIEERRRHVDQLVESLVADRAAERIGERVQVLVEDHDDGAAIGRARPSRARRSTESSSYLVSMLRSDHGSRRVVVASNGVDLVAEAVVAEAVVA